MKMVLNDHTRQYMNKMISEYLMPKSKLSQREVIQLFQDLVDSGYDNVVGGQIKLVSRYFVSKGIIKAPQGYSSQEITEEEYELLMSSNLMAI